MRESYYPTLTGARIRHICAAPGPKPLPADLRKRNVTVRLCGSDVARIEQAATAAGVTRQAWLEDAILGRLRNAESA